MVFGRELSARGLRQIDHNCKVGFWTNEEARKKWICWYSATEDRLYMKEENRWRAYRTTGRTRNRKYTRTDFIYDDLHVSARRTATYTQTAEPNTIRMEGPIINPDDHDPYKGPFTQLRYAFDDSIACKRILIDEIQIPNDNCTAVVNSIRDGTACLITDGSYYLEHDSGSSAFILTAGRTKKNKLVGVNWVPGSKEDQNPYRSELAGIDGALSMIAVLVQFFDIKQGQIEIALDGLSALKQAKKCIKDLLITQSCYDILQDISNRLKLLPEGIKIKWRHVEGHQKEKGYKNLDFWAVMNDKADNHAKAYN